jgi:hypothetical protein
MKQTKLSVCRLLLAAGCLCLVAGLGIAAAQSIDPLTDFLSGAPGEEFLGAPPQFAPPDLAELPPEPGGAMQRVEIEKREIAGGPEGDVPEMAPGRGPRLTLEQQRKLAEQRIKFLKQAGPVASDLRVKEAELAALWLDDDPSEDKIIAKAKEIDKVKGQLEELRLRNRIATIKILPPEQRRMLQMPGFRGPGQRRLGVRGGARGLRGMGRQL